MDQYLTTVRPMHEQFVEPSKRVADIVVHSDRDHYVKKDDTGSGSGNGKGDGGAALKMIVNHLKVAAGLDVDV